MIRNWIFVWIIETISKPFLFLKLILQERVSISVFDLGFKILDGTPSQTNKSIPPPVLFLFCLYGARKLVIKN